MERASLGATADTPPASPEELAHLGNEQTLGKAKQLGRQRIEAPNAITATESHRTKATATGANTIPAPTPTPRVGPGTTLSAATGKTSHNITMVIQK